MLYEPKANAAPTCIWVWLLTGRGRALSLAGRGLAHYCQVFPITNRAAAEPGMLLISNDLVEWLGWLLSMVLNSSFPPLGRVFASVGSQQHRPVHTVRKYTQAYRAPM